MGDPDQIHTFERAGLGLAPYRHLGVTDNLFVIPGHPEATKPGSSCDFCGTSIRAEHWLLSADGRKFKVGCNCIEKSGDKGLLSLAKLAIKKAKREAERAA